MASLAHAQSSVRPTEPDSTESSRWKRELREAIRDPYELCDYVGVSRQHVDRGAAEQFGVVAPRGFADRMAKGDPEDPLLLQVLPRHAEAAVSSQPLDAVGDLDARRSPGLLQKYQGRALLLVSGRCAVNCRYCFRRHFPYADLPVGETGWQAALHQLAGDASIHETILSGGDPLMLTDERLKRWYTSLEAIGHLQRLRIHTRLPVVVPSRVTTDLCRLISNSRLRQIVVLHINHRNEIDGEVAQAIGRLRSSGSLLLNQSVLLRGVNDSVTALQQLSELLIDVGVVPYYLHQLDIVAGVQHFAVADSIAIKLVTGLRQSLPGYAVPQLVRELPGAASKTPLA